MYVPDVKKGYDHNREITELKEYGGFSDIYAELIVRLLGDESISVSEGVIVPIPQTIARVGVTGPLALAESLSELMRLPVRKCLSFNRPVMSQKTLSKNEREDNVRGSMTAKPWGNTTRVFLVDEVMTTGATMREGTRALRAVGAEEVIGVIAARDAGIKSLEYAGVVKRVEN